MFNSHDHCYQEFYCYVELKSDYRDVGYWIHILIGFLVLLHELAIKKYETTSEKIHLLINCGNLN